VHASLYPDRDAVCQTCRGELGKAYYAIKRWTEQQGAASDASLSLTTMEKSKSVARFKNENTIYTPHGLGIAYSNDNLTDKVAHYIIENDPDAAVFFSVLPPADGQESGNSDSDTDTSNDENDETRPVSLSRANKEQLQGYYRTELGQEPAAELTNDELRNAIAEKRASLQDPE
jgi:hypothetical protein